jgi:hypothetical protein
MSIGCILYTTTALCDGFRLFRRPKPQKNQKKVIVMKEHVNVYLAINERDTFGLNEAMRLISARTSVDIHLVDDMKKAQLFIYAMPGKSDYSLLAAAQRKNIPVIIIAETGMVVEAERIGATLLPANGQFDWSQLFDAIEGALASYPLAFEPKHPEFEVRLKIAA